MDIEKIIEKNEVKIYDSARVCACMSLPFKKQYGYSVKNDISDETEDIINLIEDNIKSIKNLDEKNNYTWIESGWYRVQIEKISEKEFEIHVFLCLDEFTI